MDSNTREHMHTCRAHTFAQAQPILIKSLLHSRTMLFPGIVLLPGENIRPNIDSIKSLQSRVGGD